jgi:type I restriction enzyme R subunit
MKGRGCRSIKTDDIRKVSPSAVLGKSGFVVVDAVGVTKSVKMDSRPLERKRTVPTKDLLFAIALGKNDEDIFTSAASRLARLNVQLTPQQREKFKQLTGGKAIEHVTTDLLNAHNPDVVEQAARKENHLPPDAPLTEEQLSAAQQNLAKQAAKTLTAPVRDFIESARKALEQVIDSQNLDTVLAAEWNQESVANAEAVVADFRAYIQAHKDEITALRIFYDQPYRLRGLTYEMVREVLDRLKADKPALAPARVWNAFSQVEGTPAACPRQELVALVSLLRRIVGRDNELTDFEKLVRQRFQDWVFARHHGDAPKFTEEQMNWLQMIRDHIASSFHVAPDDLELSPFDSLGGLGKFYQLFGQRYQAILDELNERLVA